MRGVAIHAPWPQCALVVGLVAVYVLAGRQLVEPLAAIVNWVVPFCTGVVVGRWVKLTP